MDGASEKYVDFSVQDFVWDELFRSWVSHPTPETDFFWNSWLAANPQKATYLDTARQIVLALRVSKVNVDSTEIELQVEQIIGRRDRGENPAEPAKIARMRTSTLLKVAAVFVLLAGFGLIFYFRNSGASPMNTVATASGVQKRVTLSDSSSIVLNSNSKLTFKQHWTASETREIWMEGEGYFQVRHLDRDNRISDHERFLVHVNGLTVEVLGTTFNIRSRRNRTEVVLKEGKVRLYFDGRSHRDIFMSPEDIVTVGENDSVTVSKIQPDDYSAWIHQKLVLRDAHLSEILNYLEDNYSKKFILSDTTMLNRRIDGTLMLDNLDDALFVLSKILRVKIQKNDSTIYFIKM